MSMRSKYNRVKAFLQKLLPADVRYWLLERELRKLEEELGPLSCCTMFPPTEHTFPITGGAKANPKDLN
jgi:uncharacterized membrane protein YjdF